MDTATEEIHHLEAKIYHTQKHIEILKTANPLCDAFAINADKGTINGIYIHFLTFTHITSY